MPVWHNPFFRLIAFAAAVAALLYMPTREFLKITFIMVFLSYCCWGSTGASSLGESSGACPQCCFLLWSLPMVIF